MDLDDIPLNKKVAVRGGLVVEILKKPKTCVRQASDS